MSVSCPLYLTISSIIPRRTAASSTCRSKAHVYPFSNSRSLRRLHPLTAIACSSSSSSSFCPSFTIADQMGKDAAAVEDSSMDTLQRRIMFDDEGCEDSSMDALQRRIMFDDECILVYEYDNVVGHESKYNCHLMEKIEKENLLHRAFSCFLFNSNYDMLLQQRSATKVTFPLVWTDACCSHPLYCESELIEDEFLGVRNAAQRKLLDELGIIPEDLPVNEFTLVGRTLYKAPSDEKCGEHELDSLLFIVRDVEVNPNPDEVAGVMYVSRDQLKELLRKADAKEDGIKLSPWFRLVVNNFLMKWWDHLEKGTIHEVADMSSIHKMT